MGKRTVVALLAGVAVIAALVVVFLGSADTDREGPAAPAGSAAPGPGAGSAAASGSAARSAPAAGSGSGARTTIVVEGEDPDDRARHELIGMYGPGTMRTIPARYELQLKDGYAAVNLAGGAPTHYRAGGRTRPATPMRELRGRVIDLAGKPVAGAIVVANDSIDVMGGQLLADAGATTLADGTFTLAAVRPEAVIQAFDRTGWSDVLATTAAPIELVIRGRGELRGTLRYDGHAESFTLLLTRKSEPAFRVYYQSEPDGTYVMSSLPIGAYSLEVGLAQSIQGGASKMTKRDVTIEAGKTTTLDLDQRSSTVVIATTKVPADIELQTVEYVLLPGKIPADPSEARTRARAGEGPSQLVGGVDAKIALQFHDIDPGAYNACSAVNENLLWGCTPVVVVDGDVAREVEIKVAPVR